MPNRGNFIGGQDNLYVPDAPTVGTATAGVEQVSVAFTAPSDVGGDAVTLYGASVFLAVATINYKVSVGTGTLSTGGSGNVYFIDGIPTKTLSLIKGFTYVFDLSDSTNSGHPFAFKDSGGSSYTSGVTTSGTAGNASATVTLVLATDASEPSSYYCTSHGNGMGNTISLIAPSASTDPLGAAQAGATGSSSPVTVTGLTNGTSYIAQVWAINDYGNGPLSSASNSFTPALNRALFAGGLAGGSNSNVIDYVTISTTANAIDFGNLTASKDALAAVSSDSRGVFAGGDVSSKSNVIEYVTIASTGNAQDFGDLSETTQWSDGAGNDVRGIIHLGDTTSGNDATLEYITIASTGNSTDFGDRTVNDVAYTVGFASPSRAVFGTGYGSTFSNILDYVTIASTGNSIDFGDAAAAKYYASGFSSSTRGVIGGGRTSGGLINVIEYITIASTGNGTDFGDLLAARANMGGTSSSTRGLFGGGNTGSVDNVIQYITIASTGNATDFGDLTVSRRDLTACSSEHGGIDATALQAFAPAAIGLFFGGDYSTQSNIEQTTISYIDIATTGSLAMFGDLSAPRDRMVGGFASSTRGGVMGGQGADNSTNVDIIEYVLFSTKGKATDFGNLTSATDNISSTSNSTRGLAAGGVVSSNTDTIEYITIASAGNATDFGNLLAARQALGATSGTTRALFSDNSNVIQYVTVASTGNGTDFGDLTVTRDPTTGSASSTRAVFVGGNDAGGNASDVIDYVTIASVGNATDFGNLTASGYNLAGVSSGTRAVFGLRARDASTNVMDYITIASTGNATDWGDWWGSYNNEDARASASNSHGGIA